MCRGGVNNDWVKVAGDRIKERGIVQDADVLHFDANVSDSCPSSP